MSKHHSLIKPQATVDQHRVVNGQQLRSQRIAVRRPAVSSLAFNIIAAAAVLGGLATINRVLAKQAARKNPPTGKFIDIDGVHLHYVVRGEGPTIVLLHGNGSMINDFQTSGLIDRLARAHCVVTFDRPGFGHSTRPRSTIWTPEAQARLFDRALRQIGVSKYVVFGHSWAASIATSLGLCYPDRVQGLILASGYYYPTPKLDVVPLSAPALPIVGDIIAHTVAPYIGRIIWRAVLKKIFGPAQVPRRFKGFPKAMALRPTQLRASAAETALMVPSAMTLGRRYKNLKMPIVILAGVDDRIVDSSAQSVPLHKNIRGSLLRLLPAQGHMIHQTATDEVVDAVDRVFAEVQ